MSLVAPTVIAPGVFQVQAIGARVTVLASDKDVVLVDAGGIGSLGLIGRGLRMLGFSLEQVRLVVLTHYHPDHTGGLASLVEATGAKVGAHLHETEKVSGGERAPSPFRDRLLATAAHPAMRVLYGRAVEVDLVLANGDVLPLGLETRVVHTPGHTAGSISLLVPPRNALIVGDALQYRFRRLTPPASAVTQDPQKARESINRLAGLDFDTLCFSHYPPLMTGAREALSRLVQKLGY